MTDACSWNPAQYNRFAAPRLRPALDLMARLAGESPRLVVDLGCGTGTAAGMLAVRWPTARVVGVDSSAAMLDQARATAPGVLWQQADIATWEPETAPDVIFSNAALHWLPDHHTLLPRLLGLLAPGGVLAVQMPANFAAPSHALLRELAAETPWRVTLGDLAAAPAPVHAMADYHRWLAPGAATVESWETTYLHVLSGEDAVLNWVRGTALLPVLARLNAAEQSAFLAAYGARLTRAYPQEPDGTTLFPFRRLFLVGHRREGTA